MKLALGTAYRLPKRAASRRRAGVRAEEMALGAGVELLALAELGPAGSRLRRSALAGAVRPRGRTVVQLAARCGSWVSGGDIGRLGVGCARLGLAREGRLIS